MVKIFLPKMTGEGKTSGIQRVLKKFSPTSLAILDSKEFFLCPKLYVLLRNDCIYKLLKNLCWSYWRLI